MMVQFGKRDKMCLFFQHFLQHLRSYTIRIRGSSGGLLRSHRADKSIRVKIP